MVADGAGSTPIANNYITQFVTPLVKRLEEGQNELHKVLNPLWDKASGIEDTARGKKRTAEYAISGNRYLNLSNSERLEVLRAQKDQIIQETYNKLRRKGVPPFDAANQAKAAGARLFDSEIGEYSTKSDNLAEEMRVLEQNYNLATQDASAAISARITAGNNAYSQALTNQGLAFDIQKQTQFANFLKITEGYV